jgi:E3 ubiquitin-protein ligase SHPRH
MITYKPKELVVQEERSTGRNYAGSKKQSIYSDISTGVLKAIRSIHIDGSFGTKVDTLCRHLLWLRENDPGAKSIVFSQYKNFLEVLASAFDHFDIGFTSVDSRGGIERFKRDSTVWDIFLTLFVSFYC